MTGKIRPEYIMDERDVQNIIRLEASQKGLRVWRNNVGAGYMQDGTFLRWGLANETKAMNEAFKSSDLIGIRPVIITSAHIGTTVGQFVAREVKPSNWKYSGTKRERAQNAFLELVLALGGDAAFTIGEGSL